MASLRFRTFVLSLVVVTGTFGHAAVASAAPVAPRSSPRATCQTSFVPADAPQLQALMAGCPDGTTYTFAAGTYRLVDHLIPKDGDSFIGAGSGVGGTRLTAGKLIKGWVKTGGLWVHTGETFLAGIMPDPCADGGTACDYEDWLFRDGEFMSRVLSPCTGLSGDEFCIDYGADKMYVGAKPRRHVLEYGTIQQLMTGWRADDVTIKSLSLDEFATVGGAIAAGAGWLVDDVRAHHNHACGVAATLSTVADPATIQNSVFDHNGYHGFCNPSDAAVIVNNDFSFSNQIAFAHGSGLNIHGTTGGLIKGNDVHDNAGPGITIAQRADGRGSIGVEISSNSVTDNDGDGIRVENSCQALIKGNVVTGNYGFGIEIHDANNNTISGNAVSTPPDGDDGGIRIMADSAPGSNNCGALNDARNNVVTANNVTMGTAFDPGNYGTINGIVNTGGLTSGSAFSANDYHMPDGDCTVGMWTWWNGSSQIDAPFAAWQSTYNQDKAPGGSCGS